MDNKKYMFLLMFLNVNKYSSNIEYIHHTTYAYGFFVDIDKQSDKNDIDLIIHKN